MIFDTSGNEQSSRWRRRLLASGGALLAFGIVLAGVRFSAKAETTTSEKKAEPAKKESIEDIEKEVQKALESLKKGPVAERRQEVSEPPARVVPNDEPRRAQEAIDRAGKALREDPQSVEKRRAFEEAVRSYQRAMGNGLPGFGLPGFAPPFGPINPIGIDGEFERMQKMMEQLQLQGQPGLFNGGWINSNGFGREGRLGVRVEKPNAVLMEQLDLPANKGMVVLEVMPDSAAAKSGIKASDILLEIGGKPVSNEPAELQRELQGFKADEKIEIVLLRKGKKETIKDVVLPESRRVPVAPRDNPRIVPNARNPLPPPIPQERNDSRSMSVQIVDGKFTIKSTENGLKATVIGSQDDGPAKVSSIEIDDNGKTIKADSIEKLDGKYRPMVEKMLKGIRLSLHYHLHLPPRLQPV